MDDPAAQEERQRLLRVLQGSSLTKTELTELRGMAEEMEAGRMSQGWRQRIRRARRGPDGFCGAVWNLPLEFRQRLDWAARTTAAALLSFIPIAIQLDALPIACESPLAAPCSVLPLRPFHWPSPCVRRFPLPPLEPALALHAPTPPPAAGQSSSW